jgi:hypothetical protein
MTYPSFTAGEVLRAADMNAVGWWLVKTQTIGTGVTSIPVTNAFSADYDNYRIIIENTTTNGTASHLMELTGQTTLYYNAGEYFLWGTGGSTFFNPVASSAWTLSANVANGFYTHSIIDLINPQKATVTSGSVVSQSGNGGYNAQLLNSNTISSTGFTISKSGNTMTGGTIRVYGYRN